MPNLLKLAPKVEEAARAAGKLLDFSNETHLEQLAKKLEMPQLEKISSKSELNAALKKKFGKVNEEELAKLTNDKIRQAGFNGIEGKQPEIIGAQHGNVDVIPQNEGAPLGKVTVLGGMAAPTMNPAMAEPVHQIAGAIHEGVDKYEQLKQQLAEKYLKPLVRPMDMTADKSVTQDMTDIAKNVASPENYIGGPAGAAIAGAQMIPKYAEGGEVAQPDMQSVVAGIQPPVEQPVAATPVAQAPAPEAPTNIPLQASQQPMNVQPVDYSKELRSGIAQQQTGIQQEAQATAQQGQQEALQAQEAINRADKLMQMNNQNLQAYNNERAAIMKDINDNKIDPNHYMNKMGGFDKVKTAIGLILGGFGGPNNVASKFLDDRIAADVQAQVQNQSNRQNLLTALNQHFNNQQDAQKMLHVIYADIYSQQLQKAAAQSKSPVALARAQQAIGQLQAQNAPMLAEIAQKQAVLGGMRQGLVRPEQAVSFIVPKEHQAKVFHELGLARDVAENAPKVIAAFDDAAQKNTVLRRAGHLGAEPASLGIMRNMILPMIHDLEGKVSEFEQESMHQLEPKPGDSDAKIAQKRQGMIDFMTQKSAAPTARGFGIQPPKPIFHNVNPNAPHRK